MPTYQIKAPDGNTYRIDGPEGASDEAVREQVLKQHPGADQPAKSSGFGDFFKSIPRGAVEGFLATGASEAQAIAGSEGQEAPQIPPGPQSTEILEQNVTGPMHKPQGAAGRFGASIGEALGTPATYLSPGGSGAAGIRGAVSALASKAGLGITSATGAQAGEEVAGTPGRIIGGIIGGGAVLGARSAANAITRPESGAMSMLAKAAERDGTTLDQLQTRLREARQIRPDATIADVAGTNVRAQVERLGQTPGGPAAKVESRLTEKQQAQLGRISDDLSKLTGTDKNAFDVIEQTLAARTQEAAPLYQAAIDEGDREIWSGELARLTGAPEVQDAMGAAVKGWQRSQIANGYGGVTPRGLPQQFHEVEGVQVGAAPFKVPTGRVPVFPNLQFWDYTKGALDDMIAAQIKPDGTLTRKGRDLTIITEKLRGELDKAVPSYKAARDAWGGKSQYLNNIEEGRGILAPAMDYREMAAKFGQMSEANKEAYRIGAISAIRARMEADPAKLADFTKYLRSPAMREKISAIMQSPEAAEQWLASLEYEIKASELTGQGLKGSATAKRQALQADADSIIGDLVMNTIVGHGTSMGALGLAKAMLGQMSAHTRSILRSRSDNILVDLLTTPEGGESVVGGAKTRTSPLAAGPLARGASSSLGPYTGSNLGPLQPQESQP